MAGFTKRAIINTFFKMLEERPLNKITVTDIVKECGINRNSFYYHYEDIPTLIKDWMLSEFEKNSSKQSSTDDIENYIDIFINFVLANKKILLRIYDSVDRQIFEEGLGEKCKNWAKYYVNQRFASLTLKQVELDKIVDYYNLLFYGMFSFWFSTGLKKLVAKNYKEYIRINDVGIINTYSKGLNN